MKQLQNIQSTDSEQKHVENATSVLKPGCRHHESRGQSCKYLFVHLEPEGVNLVLQGNVLDGTPALQKLFLQNNSLSEVSPQLLSNLQILNLQHNNLSEILAKQFSPLIHLHILMILFNQIKTVHPRAFFKLGSLSTVFLNHNYFKLSPRTSFKILQS